MSDRVVIITGAGAGIGQALAVGFAREGYRVGGVARGAAGLQATAAKIEPGLFAWRTADVGDAGALDRALQELEADLGPPDALVANAAVYPRGHFLDQDPAEWTTAMIVNVCGVANACRSVLPGMLRRARGRIVIVGSLADQTPIPGSSVYCVSKGALHVLTRALAVEIRDAGYADILVNEFIPTATRTAMSARGDDPAAVYPLVRQLLELPPGGPSGKGFARGRELRPPMTLRSRARALVTKLVRGD